MSVDHLKDLEQCRVGIVVVSRSRLGGRGYRIGVKGLVGLHLRRGQARIVFVIPNGFPDRVVGVLVEAQNHGPNALPATLISQRCVGGIKDVRRVGQDFGRLTRRQIPVRHQALHDGDHAWLIILGPRGTIGQSFTVR